MSVRIPLAAALTLLATPLFAVSVTPQVSTLGYGVAVGFGVTPLFGVRVAANTGSYSRNLHKESIQYNGKLKLNNAGALLRPSSASVGRQAEWPRLRHDLSPRSALSGFAEASGASKSALVPPSFNANLEAERAKTENDIKNYKYYPVVGIGFSFGF